MATIDPTAFIAPSAALMGDVTLGAHSSVWYQAVLRGDLAPITIGAESNIQDGTIVHVDTGIPCTVGQRVGVGHRVVLHGCTIEDDCLIGMGAVVLNGATIGAGSLIAAGAVVSQGAVIPPGHMVAGVPAKVRRELGDDERAGIRTNALLYQELVKVHRDAGGEE
jgi:carbonic anhydrase/acetyltransferase-like protein (isoleucine patch superfamily)